MVKTVSPGLWWRFPGTEAWRRCSLNDLINMLNSESERRSDDVFMDMKVKHAARECAGKAEDDHGGEGKGKAEDKGGGAELVEEESEYTYEYEEESEGEKREVVNISEEASPSPNPTSVTPNPKSIMLHPRLVTPKPKSVSRSPPRSRAASSSESEPTWRPRSPGRSLGRGRPEGGKGDGKDRGGGRRELSLRRPEGRKKHGKDRGRDRGGKGSRSRSPRRPKAGRVDNRGGKGGSGPSGGHTFKGLPESAPHGFYGLNFEQTSVRVSQLLDQARGNMTWRFTQVCKKDRTGNCKFGTKCSFAHSRDELGKFMYKRSLSGFR